MRMTTYGKQIGNVSGDREDTSSLLPPSISEVPTVVAVVNYPQEDLPVPEWQSMSLPLVGCRRVLDGDIASTLAGRYTKFRMGQHLYLIEDLQGRGTMLTVEYEFIVKDIYLKHSYCIDHDSLSSFKAYMNVRNTIHVIGQHLSQYTMQKICVCLHDRYVFYSDRDVTPSMLIKHTPLGKLLLSFRLKYNMDPDWYTPAPITFARVAIRNLRSYWSSSSSSIQNESEESPKDFSVSKWIYRTPSRDSHARMSASHITRKDKKRHQKKTRQGILRKIRNESGEDIIDVDIIMRLMCDDVDPAITLYSIVAQHLAYIGNLLTCTTWSNVAMATLQFLAGQLRHLAKLDWIEMLGLQSDIQNESFADDLHAKLLHVKNTLTGLETVPMYGLISKVFMLISLVGILPEQLLNDSNIVSKAINMWTSTIAHRAKSSNFVELGIDTLAYACEFLGYCEKGCPKDFLLPSELQRRVLTAISLGDIAKIGNLSFQQWTTPEYHKEIVTLIGMVEVEMKVNKGPASLAWGRYYVDLKKILHFLTSELSANTPRVPAPIIVFYGESQIGKSLLTFATMYHAGRVMDFPTEPVNIWCPSRGDDFDSGYDANKTVIIDDDLAAEHKDYTSAKKVGDFIRYNNTIPSRTVQADLSAKGVVPFVHKLALVTTNVWHLNFVHTMSHPEAAINRGLFFEVAVHPDFSTNGKFNGPLDTSKLASINELDPRIHMLRRYTIKMVSGAPEKVNLTEWMTTREYFMYLTLVLEKHHSGGQRYVDRLNHMGQLKLCSACKLFQDEHNLYCQCRGPPHLPFPPKMNFDEIGTRQLSNSKSKRKPKVQDEAFLSGMGINIRDMRLVQFLIPYLNVVPDPEFLLIRWVASPIIGNALTSASNLFLDNIWELIKRLILFSLRITNRSVFLSLWLGVLLYAVLSAFGGWLVQARCVLTLWCVITWVSTVQLKRIITRALVEDLRSSNHLLTITAFAVKFGSVAGGIWGIVSLMRTAYRSMSVEDQGNIVTPSAEDIRVRQQEVSDWKLIAPAYIPDRDTPIANMTRLQVIALVAQNVVHVTFETTSDTIMKTNAIMVCSNYMLINRHAFVRCDLNKHISIVRNCFAGGVMPRALFGIHQVVNQDLVLVSITKAPPFKDIRKLFSPKSEVKGRSVCTMLSRNAEGVLVDRTLEWNYILDAYNESYQQPGSMHKVNTPTAVGDCGSPIVRHVNPCYIVGYHCGGTPDPHDCTAMAFAVTQEELRDAFESIEKRRMQDESYLGPAPVFSQGLKTQVCGKEVFRPLPNFHPRDIVNYIPRDNDRSVVTPIGSIPSSRSKKYSEVEVSPLSEFLEREGLLRKWGKTPFNVNRNMAASFQSILEPVENIPERTLAWAIDDYLQILPDIKARLDVFITQPLSWEEAINGIPGNKFVPALNMHTASGLGLGSPKSIHFDREDFPDHVVYTPKPYLMEEINTIVGDYARGFNSDCVYQAALKDEPTLFTKTKVRVFQVGNVAMNIVIRAFCLPILATLYSLPLEAEMAQVINCTTHEWHQLGVFISSKNPLQCIEGDFSAYDLRQSGQLIRAAGFVFSRIALALGYTPRQARLVETIFNDISSKVMVYNGSVFHVDGVNPSGVPVTIAINGLVNALLHRICYKRIFNRLYHHDPPPFRFNVHFTTVGDDSVGSTQCEWFNMREIQYEMTAMNMPYTDGHKSEITQPFFAFDQLTFCKRKWFSHPLYKGCYTAPIDPDSILKSLHCHMRSVTSPDTIAVQNASSALREFSRHPEDVWNMYVPRIKRALEAAGYYHMVQHIEYEYPDWASLMRDSYFSLQSEDQESSGSACSVESLDYGLVEQSLPSTDYGSLSSSDDDTLTWLYEELGEAD